MTDLLKPKIIDTFQEGYSLAMLRRDLLAGFIVGLLSIPMSIAFAIASGARPEQGLLTAILAGIIGALTTGSRYQITGPTGAFVILISDVVAEHGMQGLFLATAVAGILLLIMGITRLGFVIKFIPYPVTIGFTSGIALLIFTSQIPDLLGIRLENFATMPFLSRWKTILFHVEATHVFSLLIGVMTVAIVFFWPRITKAVPGSLIAIAASLCTVWATGWRLETIADRFGSLTLHFDAPAFNWPTFGEIEKIFSAAVAIALLAGIESLLSAVVADGMTGRRHRSNMELVSQGAANLASALCGGLPATGAIARTATNIKNGGISPISALVHAFVIVIFVLFLQPLLAMIPLATLAGILIVIAYNMSEWRHFKKLLKSPPGDIVVLVVTFLLTVFVDLVTAIEIGVIMAAFLFINQLVSTIRIADRSAIASQEDEKEYFRLNDLQIPEDIEVYEIQGPLFFAAVEKFKIALKRLNDRPKVLILRLRRLHSIDATGIRALDDIVDQAQNTGTILIFSGLTPEKQLYKTLFDAGLIEKIGSEHVFANITVAVDYAKKIN